LIRIEVAKYRNKVWTNKLIRLKANDNSLWKMTKIFKKDYHPIPTLEKNDFEAVTDIEKANLLASQFEAVHNIDLAQNTQEQDDIISQVQNFIDNTKTDNEWTKFITSPKEIINVIKKLPACKAPGADKIQNIILKNLCRKSIVQLTYIINACIKYSHFPTAWKTGNIVPILKSGKDKTQPSSYRPISLLPTMSKVTEKIMLNRLSSFNEKRKILIDQQFGFREKHSTVQQIIRIVNDISVNFNLDKVTVMLLLDIEKAFDRVWIHGLIYKLIKYDYPVTMIKLINSYLNNRNLYVTVNDSNSNKRRVKAGVPQGSVLGPMLFNVYLNDIPKFDRTQLALFADDTAIYAHSFNAIIAAKQVQIHMSILENFYKTWKISLNAAKTDVIVFTKKKSRNSRIIQPIKVNGHSAKSTNTVKYLG
ncbi:hypothetical protein KPH14_012919, partial [Odynerus spinipes]